MLTPAPNSNREATMLLFRGSRDLMRQLVFVRVLSSLHCRVPRRRGGADRRPARRRRPDAGKDRQIALPPPPGARRCPWTTSPRSFSGGASLFRRARQGAASARSASTSPASFSDLKRTTSSCAPPGPIVWPFLATDAIALTHLPGWRPVVVDDFQGKLSAWKVQGEPATKAGGRPAEQARAIADLRPCPRPGGRAHRRQLP